MKTFILIGSLLLALVAMPSSASARGGGAHFGRGGGFGGHVYGAPGGHFGGGFGVHPGFGVRTNVWVPGYWGWRGGARLWIGGGWYMPPYAGWLWIPGNWYW